MNTPMIVAELSANTAACKTLERAMKLVEAAARAGADAIKLQTWTPGTMTVGRGRLTSGLWAGQDMAALYEEAHTPWAWHRPLFEHARKLGMEAFSSPFDVGAVDFLEALDCPRYKIASFEIGDTRLLQRVARTGKPIIMSTGMATREEVRLAMGDILQQSVGANITLLRCVSSYPASAEHVCLWSMNALSALGPVGFSDHTMTDGAACVAAAMGATVIEKHLTLSRLNGGPDAAFSLEPPEFARYVDNIRAAAVAMGLKAEFGPGPGEMVEARRGVYWARDIKAGEVVQESDLITARPATPVSIRAALQSWPGITLHRDVKAFEPVTETPQFL